MRFGWVVSIALMTGAQGLASSPQLAVSAAAKDLAAQPASVRPYLRYLSAYNVPEKDRETLYKVLNFQVHSLSRELFFSPPVRVAKDLWRVDYREYGWNRLVWEKLAEDEPYFHLTILVKDEGKSQVVTEDWPGGVWPGDGKEYPKGAFKYERKIALPGGKQRAQGYWLTAQEIGYLATEARSTVPVVRADWFIYYTAIQEGRKAGYFDFLGLGKKTEDFEALIDRSRKIKREIGGVVGRSGVTLNNRAIYQYDEGYWVTADFKKSTDIQNVLRLLDKGTEPPEGDASERYGRLPNGLFAFWLNNAKGERQNFAPDFIASDGTATGTDRRVHIGLSCIRCHVDGLRTINDWARRQYQGDLRAGVKGGLKDVENEEAYEKIKRFRQLYTSDLVEKVEDDRRVYARALLKLTGLKPAEMAAAYAKVWDVYFEKDLGLEDVAREWGVQKEYMLKAFKTAALQGKLDPIPAGLIKEKKLPDGKTVPDPIEMRREHFEEIYAHGHEVLRGYRP